MELTLNKTDSIVVFHQAALGDWVLTWPTLRGLLAQGHSLTLVTGRAQAQLAQRCLSMPCPRAVVTTDDLDAPRWSPLFAPLPGLASVHPPAITAMAPIPAAASTPLPGVDPRVAATLASSSLLISYLGDGADAWSQRLRQLAPLAHLICIAPRPPGNPVDYPHHVTAWHAQQAAAQGWPLPPSAPPISLPPRPTGPIVIHPGSGGAAKCWSADAFARVIAALRAQGHRVQPILGEAELDRWSPTQRAHWHNDLGATLIPTYDALVDALLPARAYLGNDAGPTHLAAQLGLPTLALFGPSSATQWRPIGPRVDVLAPPAPLPMTWLPVDTVLAAMDSLLLDPL